VLRDSQAGILYQWGEYQLAEAAEPLASIPLSFPLNAWRLEYFADPASSPASATQSKRRLVVAVGTASLAVLLSLLSAFIYRESTRRMAEAANRVNFVNRVSHELKTPLTNIRLYGELLGDRLRDDDDEKARGYIATINEECARLSRLISNVLSFSRKQRDRLEIGPMDACDLVYRLLKQFARAFENRGMVIDVNLDYCPQLIADSDACEQILVNLLSNAEKYAASGGRLAISSRRERDSFVLSVADSGPGIPRHMREKVFEPFVRLSDRIDEGVSGTGMGLAIARELARLHGGDLQVADSTDGACFELVLPVKR